MTWRSRVERVLDVALRVPSLFVMDSIFLGNFLNLFITYDPEMAWRSYMMWLFGMVTCFFSSCLMFCLDLKQLLEVYSYLISFGALLLSHWLNMAYVLDVYTTEIEKYAYTGPRSMIHLLTDDPYSLIANFMFQISLSHLFIVLRTSRYSYRQIENNNSMQFLLRLSIYLSLVAPLCLRAFYCDSHLFLWTPFLALSIPVLQLVSDLYNSLYFIVVTLKRAYYIATVAVQAAGIQAFLEHHWQRIHVPDVLRVFFIVRLVHQIMIHVVSSIYDSYIETGVLSYFQWDLSSSLWQQLLVRSCETSVALLGLTSVVSLMTHYIGMIMAACVGSETEEDRNMGTVAAILFFILALQTGLTSLDPEKRLLRLYRNFCLLSTAILHFVHNMVNPLLMSLSASRSTNVARHLRALGMCVFLIVFPVWLLTFLWTHHNASTWLLAVTAFSIEVIIKVFISLLVYLLFMIDAYRDSFWEKLDDYVYYVQSTGNTIEFLFGIFLFCNGAWIMVFESGGAIRAVMMCIHAYFNIWVQAKEGWKVFIKRRTAVNKINSLPVATQEQLESVNDVCAICYQDLTSARVTRCQHFFHGVCLRKWLYVQDNCPLCHELIYKPEGETTTSPNVPEVWENHVNRARAQVVHRFQPHPNQVRLAVPQQPQIQPFPLQNHVVPPQQAQVQAPAQRVMHPHQE
ncbi:protein TRC8 homolog [Haliotis rufescens]|uniref:protein TRC8 homolog n=1 Tax=Haliotis rufescens TaxID=6454 RepID=UPI001EB02A7D|nr:protein TRC8 homolog [Haliotis rufescens]